MLELIQRKCASCGKDAILKEAGRGKDGRFERAYVCPDGHKLLVQNGEEKPEEAEAKEKSGEGQSRKSEDEPSGLQRLNKFLDELEGKNGA